ncbi:MAG TPA: FAD-dependent oxidoreductase, partial [Pyrinomonadaceae bacterium]|nr:FAD-dependent oxidoreductase [Pyrinomonadaceae bacterium]
MSKSPSPKKIVIVGGSFGGINAAYALRRRLGTRAEITLISKDAEFTFLPSLPWVILGWRDPARLQVPLDNALTRRGVRFVHGEVRELFPDKGEVRTESQTFPYDVLLIASGAELDWTAVPGLGPAAGHTQSTFTVEEAVHAKEALARVIAGESGRIVIGAAAGASCIGPAYEIAMMIDTVLRRAKKRHRFTLSFITPEPFLGHFGVSGIGMSPRMIQDEFADRDIESTVNAKVVEVRPKELVLENGDEQGFDFSLVIPSFLGAEFVRGVG